MGKIVKSIERIAPENAINLQERVMFLRHFFSYNYVASKLNSNCEVLDLGSGEGYGTYFLSKSVRNIIGIDVDKKIVNHANDKYASDNCTFDIFNGSKTNFKNESFDAIISFQVIEHVINDQIFLNEIYRLLRPGGTLYLTTPNKTMRLYPLQKPWNKFHLKEYYPFELKQLLENKFNIIDLFGIMGEQKIMDMEMKRIYNAQRKFNKIFVKFAPTAILSIKASLDRLIGELVSSDKKHSFEDIFSNESFYLIQNDVYRSLDLLAVCTKN